MKMEERIRRIRRKRHIKIAIIILLIVLVIGGMVWYKNKPISTVGGNEQNVTEKNILKKVDINMGDIGNRELNKIIPISNEQYLIITKEIIRDEDIENIDNVNWNNYYIYKYDINEGLQSNAVNIDSAFQVVGINTEQKVVYLAATDLIIQEGNVESPYKVIKVNYEKMEKEDISDTKNYYHFVLSSDGQVWSYLNNYSIYISGYNFENETLLIQPSSNNVHVAPCEIKNDNIIYVSNSMIDEEKNGIGIINRYKTNNKFINIENVGYLAYNEKTNDIFFEQVDILNKIFTVNVDTLEEKEILSWDISDDVYSIRKIISLDYKYVVVLESGMNTMNDFIQLKVFDIEQQKLITQHVLTSSEAVMDIAINGKQVMFIQNEELYRICFE